MKRITRRTHSGVTRSGRTLALGATLIALALAGPGTAAEPGIANLPGAEPFDPALRKQLAAALAARPNDTPPRTAHRSADGSPLYTNRLVLESSPYLLQHAHNPVDWYPWGEEAFAVARRTGRPLLVSIGYSTCHWCHVMEEESFDDPAIAEQLNRSFVAVKVDRETRPDIDEIYMQALHTMGQRGGWPLNIWLTPDAEPFFGGTYFPPEEAGNRPSFRRTLSVLAKEWKENPDEVRRTAGEIRQGVVERLAAPVLQSSNLPGADQLDAAVDALEPRIDRAWGGKRGSIKFPSDLPLAFLLRYHRRTGNPKTLEAVTLTLEKMAQGGVYDHVGGGFHRYATDPRWRVPHFEKMLYDNALLVPLYLEAFQVTGRSDFETVARETLDYLAREMSSREGGFYSATDADSAQPDGDMEEGLFFTWTPGEIEAVLGPQRAALVQQAYGVTSEGHIAGRSVLHRARSTRELAQETGRNQASLEGELADSLALLYTARQSRLPPGLDDKVLASWNGLAIRAFAQAGFVLGETRYTQRARKAADFVLQRMRDDGRLHRVYRSPKAQGPAFLDDYAFLIAGLLDLYEADPDPRWLHEAKALQDQVDTHYADPLGGYFTTADFHEPLLVRSKPRTDGALPSGNGVTAHNLLRLASYTEEARYARRAELLFSAFAPDLESRPASLGSLLSAADYRLDTPFEIVVVHPASGNADALLAPLRSTFVPNRILTVVAEGDDARQHRALVPLIGSKSALGGQPTAYVCVERVCAFPTSDPEILAEQIQVAKPLRNPPR